MRPLFELTPESLRVIASVCGMSVGTGQGSERRDRVRVIGMSATWQAWRDVLLIADHWRELRSSNYSVFHYDVDITSVFVQARFD